MGLPGSYTRSTSIRSHGWTSLHATLEKDLEQVHRDLRPGRSLWSTEHITLSSHHSAVNPDVRILSVNFVTLLADSHEKELQVDEILSALRNKLME